MFSTFVPSKQLQYSSQSSYEDNVICRQVFRTCQSLFCTTLYMFCLTFTQHLCGLDPVVVLVRQSCLLAHGSKLHHHHGFSKYSRITAILNLLITTQKMYSQILIYSLPYFMFGFLFPDFFLAVQTMTVAAVMVDLRLLQFVFLLLLSCQCLDRDNCWHCKRLHQRSVSVLHVLTWACPIV